MFIHRKMAKAREVTKKEEVRKRLAREKKFNEWAVSLVRKGRHNEARQ